MNTAITVEPLN